MIKNLSIVIIALLALGGYVFTATRPAEIVKTDSQKFGSATSPDISSPYLAVNGLQTWSANVQMVQGASTTCQFQTPPATTTLTVFNYRFGFASTSAVVVDMGKSTGPNATTTLYGTTYGIGAGNQATVEASSTTGSAGDAMILAPSTWLAVKMGGGALGSLPTGSCDFEVQALQ